jgi:hypothetical protein
MEGKSLTEEEAADRRSWSFATDIKPLFRQQDRESMMFAFDLWNYQDVVDGAQAILARLLAGDMPCDGGWPTAQVQAFQGWLDAGTPP